MEKFVHCLHTQISIRALNACIQTNKNEFQELFLGSLRCCPEQFYNLFYCQLQLDEDALKEAEYVCNLSVHQLQEYKNKFILLEKDYPTELIDHFLHWVFDVYKRTK